MADPLQAVKPAVRALSAYTLPARAARVKLDQNENPYEIPEAVKRRVIEAALARPWGRYPEFDPRELRTALGAFAGWRANGVLAGNGSNELIEALLLVTVGAGTRVAIPQPTFTLYALLTRILGGEVVPVPLAGDLSFDLDALLAARRAGAPVTVVCSPNNPTGAALPVDDVSRLCAAGPGLVVVDEAYHEFAGQTVAPLLREHRNLVVLRTFSKAMALAGLRVGYLLADPALVREIDKARLPYNLNVISQAAALALLQEPAAMRGAVEALVRSRDRLFERLSAHPGLRVFPSRANFLLLELLEAAPRPVFEALHARGVLVRDVSGYPRLERCLRVSVGTDAENAAFLDALGAALAPAAARAEAP